MATNIEMNYYNGSEYEPLYPTASSCLGNSATATTATSATKLSTGRTIQTDLSSTSSASFDGSANITPGITGTLPVANGGTGTTSLASLATNLSNSLSNEFLSISGGTLTGNLRLKNNSNYGLKLNFGDEEYVYISEPTDDYMTIYAKNGIDIKTLNNNNPVTVNGANIPKITSGTSSLTAGSSALTTGDIYLVYE